MRTKTGDHPTADCCHSGPGGLPVPDIHGVGSVCICLHHLHLCTLASLSSLLVPLGLHPRAIEHRVSPVGTLG